jgi:hypothetical protein
MEIDLNRINDYSKKENENWNFRTFPEGIDLMYPGHISRFCPR